MCKLQKNQRLQKSFKAEKWKNIAFLFAESVFPTDSSWIFS